MIFDPNICLEELKKLQVHLLNRSRKHYHYTILFGETLKLLTNQVKGSSLTPNGLVLYRRFGVLPLWAVIVLSHHTVTAP